MVSKIFVAAGGPKKTVKAAAVKGKTARLYPADDVPVAKKSRKATKNAPKTRASITPGTVVILLSGRFRGKRVVCLKVLASGLLLVSGPFKVNGVPLKRVNAAYVIATTTKVDLKSVKVPESINDAYFARVEAADASGEAKFFKGDKSAAVVSDARKADQKTVDAALSKVVNATPMLKQYLGARFSLTNNDRPHNMVF
jgi:large subunit ribosomal protein L6e